jgi:hypothetical protein
MFSDNVMWKCLPNDYSHIKQTRLKSLSQSVWQPTPRCPFFSYQPPSHRRLLVFPVCTIIIGEDSFVITSRQLGIDSCLQQCVLRSFVHSPFLESIMLFSNWKKQSLYPSTFRYSWTSTELYSFEQVIWQTRKCIPTRIKVSHFCSQNIECFPLN